MNDLDLPSLWQDQRVDEFPVRFPRAGVATTDFSVPTSRFQVPRRVRVVQVRRPFLLASLAAAMVAAVVGGLASLRTPAVAVAPPAPLAAPAKADLREDLDALLAECRTWSSSEAGAPDWARAERACTRALELEPIDAEAQQLQKRIGVLRTCEHTLDGARQLLAAGRLESGLAELVTLDSSCETFFLRAMPLAREIAIEVKARAATECKAYAANSKWELALPRCELYARLACQSMEPVELYPPALSKVKLTGPLNPRTEWRPKDAMYLNFLVARERVLPGAPRWACPDLPSLRAPAAPPNPSALAESDFKARYQEPQLALALIAYFNGDLHSGPAALQKVIENMGKAQWHAQARELLLDVNEAHNLYAGGLSALMGRKYSDAAATFQRALVIDERLVLGARAATLTDDDKKRELQRRQSFLRRNIVDQMANETYSAGKSLADRKDFRAACVVWKLGSTFSRGHLDLLKALTNVCTARAAQAFERAETCTQLKAARDFAVDGDGFAQKIDEAMADQACP